MGFLNTVLMAMEMGTGWFYSVSFLTFVIILALNENEKEFFSFFVLAGFIFLMEKAGTFNLFDEPWMLVQWIGIYFVAGIFWSFVKWFAYLHTKSDELRGLRMRFLRDKMSSQQTVTVKTKVPDELKEDFNKYLVLQGYHRYIATDSVIPQIRDNKEKCINWIIWWPTSFIWTMLSDPMVRIANLLFARLRGCYQGVANRVFSEFE